MSGLDLGPFRVSGSYTGDCMALLPQVPDGSVQCVVTSPPYFGLRSYLPDDHPDKALEIGTKETPDEYVAKMVAVFREVRRVLRDDGTLWLNLGDSYANVGKWGGASGGKHVAALHGDTGVGRDKRDYGTLKPKDLIGIPWRVAFALQADGWYLRSDIIWCLSGGAWVYARTQKGDMPTMVKDLVRLRPETVQLWNGGRWTQALGWSATADASERIEIVLRSGERIGCTGGHQWPTQRGLVTARDLRSGDVLETCGLPEPIDARRPGYLTDDLLWLTGLYLAEGSAAGANSLSLALHSDEATWLPRITMAAAHLGASTKHYVSGGNLAVVMHGAVLATCVRSLIGGRTSHDKHLRTEAWKLANADLRLLMDGYLCGDGHADPRNDRFRLGFTRNYALERDLRTLAARLDATITLNPTEATNTTTGRRHPCFRGEWRWARSGHHNEKARSEIVDLRHSRARQFWDIGVADEPHTFALASGVLTHNSKPNPMPESVIDRPTKGHEYLFLLTKSPHYFYDSVAIAEASTSRAPGNKTHKHAENYATSASEHGRTTANLKDIGARATRNRRTVWTIGSEPCSDAHFAVMPTALVKPCIQAGTSSHGACAACGSPWEMCHSGWRLTCDCVDTAVRPCVVLDPFLGSGAVGRVAEDLGRYWIGFDINAEYAELQRQRTAQIGLAL